MELPLNPRSDELEADINDLQASLEKNPISENVNESSYLLVSFGDEDIFFQCLVYFLFQSYMIF